VRVLINGPKVNTAAGGSSAKGGDNKVVKVKQPRILVFSSLASESCGAKRVGVTGVSMPPVTG
jgi:hypothetical protein